MSSFDLSINKKEKKLRHSSVPSIKQGAIAFKLLQLWEFNCKEQYLKAGPKGAKSISKMFGVGGGAMHVHVHHQRPRSFNNKDILSKLFLIHHSNREY
jgi:hypothetical protein